MAERVVNMRSLRNERDWLPGSLDEAAMVHAALENAGLSNQVSNGIVGWLVAKSFGHEDRTMPATRSTYRKVLAGLQSPLSSRDDMVGYLSPAEAA